MTTVVTKQGDEMSVSIYEPYDMGIFYVVLGSGIEVKSFEYSTSGVEALELFRQHDYTGCPTDREYYLDCIRFDLGVSYTLEWWDAN